MHTQSKFRLLVVRLGAMGDILHALPAVTALRKAHPQWEIDWVVEPRWRGLLTAAQQDIRVSIGLSEVPNPVQPLVNALHFAPTKQWRRTPFALSTLREVKTLHRALKVASYDVVLDLQGAIRSAVVSRMAGSVRVIGEAHPRESAARWFYSEVVECHAPHVIEQAVELASAVAGDDLAPETPWLPVDPTAEAWVDRILPLGTSQPAVLINPGAGWGAKRWPVDRYAALAQGLLNRGLSVLVNAGPGEEALSAAVVESAPGAVAVSCTLEQLIALTRRVALAIAGDTGPLHLACALGRPVVGLYGPTDPSRNGPFGAPFKVLRSPESRRDHTRHALPEAGLMTILPEQALEAADQLLSQENAR